MKFDHEQFIVVSIDEDEAEIEIVGHEAAHRNNAEILDLCHNIFSGDARSKELLMSIEETPEEYDTALATSVDSLAKNAPTLQAHANIYTYTTVSNLRALALRNIIALLAQSVSIHIFVTTAQQLCKCRDTPVLLKMIMAMYAAYMEDAWLLEGDSAEYWQLYGDSDFRALLLLARKDIEMRRLRVEKLQVDDVPDSLGMERLQVR